MSFTQETLCMSLHVRVLRFFDIQQAFFSSYMQKNKHSGTVLSKTIEKGNTTSIVSVPFLFLFSS